VDEGGERRGVQRRDGELQRVPLRQRMNERGQGVVRLAAADGGDHLRPARLEPPQDERQDRGRGGVEPLPVIDGEQHLAGARGKQRPAGERRQARVDRLGRILQQQRRGERAALRRGQRVEPVEHRLEQVVQRRVRARGLGRRRPRAEDRHRGALDDRPQQRRLADAGGALNEHGVRGSPATKDLPQQLQLRFQSDDRMRERLRATLAGTQPEVKPG
jgi:hypothetical protein